jgi:uncharacterized protein HemX
MSANQPPSPEAPEKRGRLEIRVIIAIVVAIILGGAVYSIVAGSPDPEEQARDSTNYNPFAEAPAEQPAKR